MEVRFLISTHCFGFSLLPECWPLRQLIPNSHRTVNNSVPFRSLSFHSSFPVTFVLFPLWAQFIHGVTVNHIWYINRENYGFTTVTEFHVWQGTGEASWESNLSRQIEVRESDRHRRERGMKEKEKLKEKMASPLEVLLFFFLLHTNLVMGGWAHRQLHKSNQKLQALASAKDPEWQPLKYSEQHTMDAIFLPSRTFCLFSRVRIH